MSPFSLILYDLRMRYDVRQAELAEQLGYEQAYISALEVGLKGPPTSEFVERLVQALPITPVEECQVREAAHASDRKLVIASDAPPDVYWLLKDLREAVNKLSPGQVRVIRDILKLPETLSEMRREPIRRLKRRRNEEAK